MAGFTTDWYARLPNDRVILEAQAGECEGLARIDQVDPPVLLRPLQDQLLRLHRREIGTHREELRRQVGDLRNMVDDQRAQPDPATTHLGRSFAWLEFRLQRSERETAKLCGGDKSLACLLGLTKGVSINCSKAIVEAGYR